MKTKKNDTPLKKLRCVNWSFLLIVTIISCIGFLTLYSAAQGHLAPWAEKQIFRFMVGMLLLLMIALTDLRIWLKYAYILYCVSFIALIVVECIGRIAGGAQRWINLYIFHLQPSELMKIALILALARYFHFRSDKEIRQIRFFIFPLLLILAPVILVILQPDLGTALMMLMSGGIIVFAAGLPMGIVLGALGSCIGLLPILWLFLHDYQKQRVLTFLDPGIDPLGSGYHIIQSKIALGSGGILGKGLLKGSQSYLDYLPEKQTDFIFTMFSEEFGLLGGIILLSLYGVLIYMGYVTAHHSRHQFGRLICLGIISTVFLYVFINMAMVMGLLPVVGVPLPLMSYGGTAMLSMLMGLGFLMSVQVHPHIQLHRPTRYD